MKTPSTTFDGLAKSHPVEVDQDLDYLHKQLLVEGCKFGSDAIPCFLKPYFLSQTHTTELKKILHPMSNIVEKVVRAYFDDPGVRHFFGISKGAHAYMEIDPGYKRNIVIARPDAFFHSWGMQFLEFNCDSPAGAGWTDSIEGILRKTSLMKKVQKHYSFKNVSRVGGLLKALLECYKQYGGSRRNPHIAIVDWRDVKTRNEFILVKQQFEAKGYPTVIADPRDLKIKSGRLYLKGFRVDIIYRRVIFNELWDKRRYVQDFLKAYRMGMVCVANPLRSRLAAHKSVLAILSNPEYDYLFNKEELKVRNRVIPWTRRLLDAQKFYGGKKIYLRQMVVENQKDLVLKPSDSYGGKDVKIGREISKKEWRKTVDRVIRNRERWVVQEFVKIPTMKVPVRKGKRVVLVEKKMNINPFILNGKYAGSVVRLSDASVINVSAGGGLVPVIHYGDRQT